mmetsp:Transcript_5284/g.6544  ORF Transcript_5284/g.6544 Transcript_5284/m.6544 type:complete len:117 (-) Transcript_5284:18-368(-)
MYQYSIQFTKTYIQKYVDNIKLSLYNYQIIYPDTLLSLLMSYLFETSTNIKSIFNDKIEYNEIFGTSILNNSDNDSKTSNVNSPITPVSDMAFSSDIDDDNDTDNEYSYSFNSLSP